MLKAIGIIAGVVLFVVIASVACIPSGWIMVAVGGFMVWNRLRSRKGDAPSEG
jgi:hypothetical protein